MQTSTGYEVAWQVGNSFIIWNTDSNGNYLSQSGTLSGASTALEIAETIFHHDLNGDGMIGVTSTLIESDGTTSLVAVADQYALEDSHGNGPHISLNGAPVVVGQLSPWSPVAAVQTSTGYDVAWQDGNSFIIWNTDSNANVLSISGVLSGTSTALENYETIFNHDLNGDGIIGIPPGGGATAATTANTAALHSDNFDFRQDLSGIRRNGTSDGSGATGGASAAAQVWHSDNFAFHQDNQDDGPVGAASAVVSQTAFPVPTQAWHFDGLHQDLRHNGTIGVGPEGGTHLNSLAAAHWHFDLIA